MDTHDYVPDCECRECLRVTLRDTVAAAERLALERAEFRRESEHLREELAALRAQKPVLCVPASIANDCAHIAARGQFEAAIEVARRYSQPFYAAPAPAAVPDDVARDAARYRWIRDDMKNLYGDEVLAIIGESGRHFDAAIDAAMLAAAASATQEGKP